MFKVNQKVRTKEGKFVGVITDVMHPNDERHRYYCLDIDNGSDIWTDEMLEPVEEDVVAERWRNIAKILGVELGEEFDILTWDGYKKDYNPYRITEEGLKDYEDENCNCMLGGLVTGEYKIEKLPWKPKEDEEFYYYNIGNNHIVRTRNDGHTEDLLIIKNGLACRTREEAETVGKEKTIEYFGGSND